MGLVNSQHFGAKQALSRWGVKQLAFGPEFAKDAQGIKTMTLKEAWIKLQASGGTKTEKEGAQDG